MKNIYIIQKYVLAESIEEALKLEKKIKPDECFLDKTSQTAKVGAMQTEQVQIGYRQK